MWKAIQQFVHFFLPCIGGFLPMDGSPSSLNPAARPEDPIPGSIRVAAQEQSYPLPRQPSTSQPDVKGQEPTLQPEAIPKEGAEAVKGQEGIPLIEQPAKSLPPWVEYEPDRTSLKSIHDWNKANPGNKFSAVVLGKVTAVLRSKVLENLVEFIPNDPIPAKSLVSTLISLAVLGTEIPEAKQKISSFAEQVATDISLLADALGDNSDSPLLVVAWDDLQRTW
ncbi:hypothetical protein B0H13DRAFT_1909373 [Mycena leptocephala]|nr:hypothetical protein B0H13DRAFT_1909373 [Mycena leptocephala]